MIEWIVTSSALIVLVALLRIIIKDRISPRLRYALWGLVLLRLLIPGTLWESRASVMTPVAAQETYQAVERVPRYVRTQPDGWVEIGHPTSGNRTSIPPESEVVRTDRPTTYEWFDPEEAVSLTELREQVNLRDAFLWAWLAGSTVVSAFLLAVNLKFNRTLKKSRRALEQYRGRSVFVVDGLPTPCLFGLFRPAVYLTPDVAEDDAAKAHVLAHEYAHFRQGDHVWALLRGVCLAVHWYNPLVWLAAYLSRRDCELSCDEGAVRLLGEESRADYGRTLVGLVARRTTARDLACCATTMTGGKSALKERVALLVKRPRTTAVMAALVAVACIAFAVCTFTGAAVEEAKEAEPEPDAPEEVLPVDNENLPDVENLPASWDWDAPIWLLDRIAKENIFIYQDRKTGVNYLRRGDHLQALGTRNMYDQQGPNDIELTYRDLDGNGTEELAITYRVTSASGAESRELLICQWDGQRWTEHHPEGIVPALVRDFRENHEISAIWSDPGMGETPGPSILSVNWDEASAAFEVSPWLYKTGGTLACALDERQYAYHVGTDGIELVIYGEASYTDSPVEDSRQFWYACPVVYRTDGTFAIGPGALNTRPPENLPTEPMDLNRPAEEQGPWLLLAQAPTTDAALYRSAWDDQHVYLRVTNGSFQAFERDLSGMELLPTLDLWDGDADYAVRALYRRYEGTYFNGTSYEPGVVADQAIYLWSPAEKYWREAYIATQPVGLKTEDLPVIADLPGIFGIYDWDAPMWWVGTVREEGISLYWAQYEEQMYLRYGNHIQRIDDELGCEWLPELYFEDLDDDGDRELLIHYHTGHGTGVHTDYIAVHEWDGESWHGTRHTPDETIEGFNNDLDLIFEWYGDGTAFIKNRRSSILLDLSDLWASGYWKSPPKKCELSQWWTEYAYQDGQIMLTIAGGLWNEEVRPYGYIFDYVCPVVYMDHGGGESYLGSGVGVLQSEYAVEPEQPEFTDTWRTILEKTWAECSKDSSNRYAVYDVNGDGKDELIVTWMPEGGLSMAWGTSVYSANGMERFHGYGELIFYSNGAISVPWSHNQGAASAIWPYDLCVCSTSYRYSYVGSARARSDDAPGFEDVAYADLDGDGVVYYIGEDAYYENNPVDNDVYAAWLDRYLAGAQVLPVQYFPLTEDAIS